MRVQTYFTICLFAFFPYIGCSSFPLLSPSGRMFRQIRPTRERMFSYFMSFFYYFLLPLSQWSLLFFLLPLLLIFVVQVRAPPQGLVKLKKLLEERVQSQPRKFERVMRRRDKNRDGCVVVEMDTAADTNSDSETETNLFDFD